MRSDEFFPSLMCTYDKFLVILNVPNLFSFCLLSFIIIQFVVTHKCNSNLPS